MIKKAYFLADKFNENFKKYEKYASNEIINAMPKSLIEHED